MKDYFKILGVSWLANDAEIKKAYRQLVLQYHPDKNSSSYAATIFMEIQEAYDVIGNSISRKAYIYQYKVIQQQNQTKQQQNENTTQQEIPPLYQKVKYKASNNEYTKKEVVQILSYTALVLLVIIAFSVLVLRIQTDKLEVERKNLQEQNTHYNTNDWAIVDSNHIEHKVSEAEMYQILQEKFGLTEEQVQQIMRNRK
ncbi:MAG: DnaJ domain-containing protein [Chitinophagales bacterium]|nr:DnaJ domain-containing protein [Chitinophagales bacterium]